MSYDFATTYKYFIIGKTEDLYHLRFFIKYIIKNKLPNELDWAHFSYENE